MGRSFRITTEPHHIDAVDEFEAISSWFQMIQFTGFFIQEYEDANPVGEKGNRRLVIAENKTGGQLIISVKEESKADMIRANQDLRHNLEKEIETLEKILTTLPKDSRAYDMNKYRLLGYQNLLNKQQNPKGVEQ